MCRLACNTTLAWLRAALRRLPVTPTSPDVPKIARPLNILEIRMRPDLKRFALAACAALLPALSPALATASCADAAVTVFGVPFEFWSIALAGLLGAGAARILVREEGWVGRSPGL